MNKYYAYKLRQMIEKASTSLNDSDALDAKELYARWEANKTYEIDTRLRYNNKLWKVIQAHTSLENYPPSIYTASLYAEVERPGQGDVPSNPIIYNGNMELFNGKYYSEDGIIYQCIRDSGIPLYNRLADLVNMYVIVYND